MTGQGIHHPASLAQDLQGNGIDRKEPLPWARSIGLLLLLATTGLGFGIIGFTSFSVPFAILSFLGIGWFGYLGVRSQRVGIQNVGLVVVSICFCLGGAEVYLFFSEQEGSRYEGEYEFNYFVEDHELGYGPKPANSIEVKKFHNTELLYDVQYTIDEFGLRHIPESVEGKPCTAAFFGGSITFGEGVQDSETMPAVFVRETNGQYQGYNFGFHGYGPHQMLRAIETGRLETIVGRPVHLVVYQGIEAHVARSAGKASWDVFGPRYVLDQSGGAVYQGPFHGERYRILHRVFKNSHLFKFIETHLVAGGSFEPDDLTLYVQILKRTREEIMNKYGANFVILFWDKGSGQSMADTIMRRLQEENFQIIPISHIIPDIETKSENYVLSKFDPHPNALAHRIIGTYLARQIRNGICGKVALEPLPS